MCVSAEIVSACVFGEAVCFIGLCVCTFISPASVNLLLHHMSEAFTVLSDIPAMAGRILGDFWTLLIDV